MTAHDQSQDSDVIGRSFAAHQLQEPNGSVQWRREDIEDAHVCQKCSNKPEPNLLTCAPTRDSLLGITPIIQAEGDSETERDYSDTEEKQDLSKSQTITYTTVHFNNKKQCPDYENIVETPEYVNVDLKDTNGKNKKVKKKVKSVDYSMVAPMPVPFRRPSHPPATSTDSLSS
ncbi:uncharacterized protein LOC143815662 isoform X2 [Ranitomeya variabilis]|uniref:uncharacterized protein LOC143815662 isoform X2 n=1 Tax=Ranitomeya variabilis TaxID=490064 RepID=UPI004055FC27